jgi:hypothetical protein
MKIDDWFRNRAKELYHEEGEIEVDNDARVSKGGNDGAYVEAWVWVALTKEKATHGFGVGNNPGRRSEGKK